MGDNGPMTNESREAVPGPEPRLNPLKRTANLWRFLAQIVGHDDFICPPSASEYLHREIACSKLVVVENAGHFPWLEKPEQFFGAVQAFLPKMGYQHTDR